MRPMKPWVCRLSLVAFEGPPLSLRGGPSNATNDSLHTHGFMGLIHVLHASGSVAFLHCRLRHIEMHCRFLFLLGVGHLRDHVIHLLHMGVVAKILSGIHWTERHSGQKR